MDNSLLRFNLHQGLRSPSSRKLKKPPRFPMRRSSGNIISKAEEGGRNARPRRGTTLVRVMRKNLGLSLKIKNLRDSSGNRNTTR